MSKTEEQLLEALQRIESRLPDPSATSSSRVDDAESSARRAEKRLKKLQLWMALTIPLAGSIITALGWAISKLQVDAVATEHEQIRVQRVDAKLEQLDKTTVSLEKIAVENQVQLVDGLEYLGERIDASLRGTPAPDVPDTIQRAQNKVARLKAKQRLEQIIEMPDEVLP
jgi:hypothetical protein